MKVTQNEILVSNENTKSGIRIDHIGGNETNTFPSSNLNERK